MNSYWGAIQKQIDIKYFDILAYELNLAELEQKETFPSNPRNKFKK